MICKAYTSEYEVDTVIVRPGHIFGPSAKKDDKRISSDFAFKAAMGEKTRNEKCWVYRRDPTVIR